MQEEIFNAGESKTFFHEAFAKLGHKKSIKHLAMTYECLKHFVKENMTITRIKNVREYQADYFACQMAHGDTDVMLGLSGSVDAMLYLAGCVAGEKFDGIDEDSYDALCEFANLANGKFSAFLEEEGMEMDVVPPMCCENCRITAEGNFCVMTLLIHDKELDIISVIDMIPYLK